MEIIVQIVNALHTIEKFKAGSQTSNTKISATAAPVLSGDYHLPAVKSPANLLSIMSLSDRQKNLPPGFKFLMFGF